MITKQEYLIVEDVKNNFTYHYDRDKYDRRDAWYVMYTYPYEGDCEDYALTCLYNLKGRSWFNFWKSLLLRESKIVYCKSPSGGGHAVLKYKGMYIDNWDKEFVKKSHMVSVGYNFSSWMYIPYQVAIKLLYAKLGFDSNIRNHRGRRGVQLRRKF